MHNNWQHDVYWSVTLQWWCKWWAELKSSNYNTQVSFVEDWHDQMWIFTGLILIIDYFQGTKQEKLWAYWTESIFSPENWLKFLFSQIPVQSMQQIVTSWWLVDCQNDSNNRKSITIQPSIQVERNNCHAFLWERCHDCPSVSSQCAPSAFLVGVWIV